MSETATPAPPPTISIEYMRCRLTVTFFTNSHGANVYIGKDGKFYTCLATVWICKPSLAKIEREIINFAKGVSIKVFYQDDDDKVQVEEIIGLQGKRIVFKSGRSIYKGHFSTYRYDEKVMKKVADYWKRKAESEVRFEKEWEKVSHDLERISEYSIEKELAAEAQRIRNEGGTNPA